MDKRLQHKFKSLRGMNPDQLARFYLCLEQRARCGNRERADYRLPAELQRHWPAQWWWAFFTELQDRPLWSLAGLLATVSYPFLWALRHFK